MTRPTQTPRIRRPRPGALPGRLGAPELTPSRAAWFRAGMPPSSEDPLCLRHVLRIAAFCLWIALATTACNPESSPAPTASQDPTHPSHSSEGTSPTPAAGTAGPAAAAPAAAGQEVQYGVLVDFTIGGGSDPLKVSGWSKAEPDFTWTQGTTAILAARVKPTEKPVTMRLKAAGMIKPPDLPFQPVEVFVNNEKVADLQVGDTAEFSIAIPPEMTKAGGLLTITFRVPKAASPKALGLNQDERVLGIRVFNLTLDGSA